MKTTEKKMLEEAAFIASTGATVREAAKVFGVSKSCIHAHVTEGISRINPSLCADVRAVLATNKAERHIRGGEATRRRWQSKKL